MHTTTISWEGPIQPSEVTSHLKRMLFSSMTGPIPQEALSAEIVRVAIWEQSALRQQLSSKEASVSTQKVLHRARLLWSPFSSASNATSVESAIDQKLDGAERTLSRRDIDSLAEQGDILSLPEGQWLPAPLRLVPISSERYLLVGGVPSKLLTSSLFQEIHLHGSFRQLDASLLQKYPTFDGRTRWPFQTQESWLGPSAPPLKELLQKFHTEELLSVSRQDQQEIEVYVSSLDKPQLLRWCPLKSIRETKRYLLRNLTPWGQRRYTIGYIENGQLKQQSQLQESYDIRRLCYALDAAAQKPTRATWNQSLGKLTLCSELPARERKRLATIGNLQTNDIHYYPRTWLILPDYERDVQDILQSLAVIMEAE